MAKVGGFVLKNCDVSLPFMQFSALLKMKQVSTILAVLTKSLSNFNLYYAEVIAHIIFKSLYIHSMLSRQEFMPALISPNASSSAAQIMFSIITYAESP